MGRGRRFHQEEGVDRAHDSRHGVPPRIIEREVLEEPNQPIRPAALQEGVRTPFRHRANGHVLPMHGSIEQARSRPVVIIVHETNTKRQTSPLLEVDDVVVRQASGPWRTCDANDIVEPHEEA